MISSLPPPPRPIPSGWEVLDGGAMGIRLTHGALRSSLTVHRGENVTRRQNRSEYDKRYFMTLITLIATYSPSKKAGNAALSRWCVKAAEAGGTCDDPEVTVRAAGLVAELRAIKATL